MVQPLTEHWRGPDFVDGWNFALQAVEEEQASIHKETT